MFCNQCEQTQNGRGCTDVGVCGKDENVQSLQEILLYGLKGMAAYANQDTPNDSVHRLPSVSTRGRRLVPAFW